MRILAIDDEKLALKVLKEAIIEAIPQAEVFASSSIDEVIDQSEHSVFDVAFCDINMGSNNGLEVAKMLKKTNPKINIIFVTGYTDYFQKAIGIHASGYIMKPVSSSDIKDEMNNLLYPIQSEYNGLYARTFGNFEFFVNGKPVNFSRSKSKEMLAYLIDRRGAMVSKKELIAVLFEDKEYD